VVPRVKQVIDAVNSSLSAADGTATVDDEDHTVAELLEDAVPAEKEKGDEGEHYENDFEDAMEDDQAASAAEQSKEPASAQGAGDASAASERGPSSKSLFGRTLTLDPQNDSSTSPAGTVGEDDATQGTGDASAASERGPSSKSLFGRTLTLDPQNDSSTSPAGTVGEDDATFHPDDADGATREEYVPDFEDDSMGDDAPVVDGDLIDLVSGGPPETKCTQEEGRPAEQGISDTTNLAVNDENVGPSAAVESLQISEESVHKVRSDGTEPEPTRDVRNSVLDSSAPVSDEEVPVRVSNNEVSKKDEASNVAKKAVLAADQDGSSLANGEQREMPTSPVQTTLEQRVGGHKISAELSLEKGASTAAVEELSEAMRIMPNDPILFSMRATAFLQAGKAPEAIRDLEESLRLDPSDAKMFLRLVHLCIGTADLQAGIQAIRSGHAAHPDNTELLHLLNEYSLSPAKRWAPDASFSEEVSGRATQADTSALLKADEGDSHKGYEWRRKTMSGKFFQPVTSSVRTIEARQRKIREKCVQLNLKKEQQLVGERKRLQDAAAEVERSAQVEAKKKQVTQQLDIVHDCLQIIENEKLIKYGQPPTDSVQRRHIQKHLPRFTQTEDVVREILLYLEREIPMDHDLLGHEQPSIQLQRKAEIVQDVVNHVTKLSNEPIKVLRSKDRSSTLASLIPQVLPEPKSPTSTPPLRHGLSSPSIGAHTMEMPSPLSSLSSGNNSPDGKLPDIRRRWSPGAPTRTASGDELSGIPLFQKRGSVSLSGLSTVSESLLERLSSLASQTSQRSLAITDDAGNASPFVRRESKNHMSLDEGGHSQLLRSPFIDRASSRGHRAAHASEPSEPSYTKLPLKAHSSSLSHACGLQTRGGFL